MDLLLEKGTMNSENIKICSALFQVSSSFKKWDTTDTAKKFLLLENLISYISSDTDILLLPAGFINTKNNIAKPAFKMAEKIVRKLIKKHNPKLHVCLGIDGLNKKEQFALSINQSGIIAIARKFYHMDASVKLAITPFDKENNKERFFEINTKKAYLAVCYDAFGISRLKLDNPNCDFILNVVHGFDNSGGDSDFARKGLAGAAKKWGLNVYASAVFANSRNPANWTAGVRWTHGNNSVKDYKYDDIRIHPKVDTFMTAFTTIYLRYYEE